jgi:hypothetical protein
MFHHIPDLEVARLRLSRRNSTPRLTPWNPWFHYYLDRTAFWDRVLQKIRGETGSDGVNRIATERVFDVLDLPRFQRTPEAGKRIKTIMMELGWTPVRARHVTSRGRAARVRGYARMPARIEPSARTIEP